MAGAMFLRPTASGCPRVTYLLVGRICYSIKRTALEHLFTNEQLPQQVWKRSIYMSKGHFSLAPTSFMRKFRSHNNSNNNDRDEEALFSTKRNVCRPQSYLFCRRTSHMNRDGGVDVKDNLTKRPADSATELTSSLSDSDHAFSKKQSEHFTEITREDEENYGQIKAAHSNISDSSLHNLNVTKKHTNFEYDYQVAEDIEEYDYIDETRLAEQQVRPEKVLPISLQRGKTGVFDLHELITLLEHLGAENIVTFPVPAAANFCDDMVVVSAKSQRHLQAINDELLWVHKRKKSQNDPNLVIEGKDKTTWCAMDMGNIVLHVFFGDDKREYYDIESLWTLGPDKDPKSLEQHSDPYALSPEDLFWQETGNAAVKDTDTANSDKDTYDNAKRLKSAQTTVDAAKQLKKLPEDVTDSKAGWGISNSTSVNETK